MLARRTHDDGKCSVVVAEGIARGVMLGLIWEGLQVFKGRTKPSIRAAANQVALFTAFILPIHLFDHGCLFEFQQKQKSSQPR
mmetsp:Transcript_29500/g.83205  ORF Transcript_29500/g.83205 Transcript_29500/m.83205 type:complete len:83 (-) Transcript_29500:305-553(-)